MTKFTQEELNWLDLVFSEYDNIDLAIQLSNEISKDVNNLPQLLLLWINHRLSERLNLRSIRLGVQGCLRYIHLKKRVPNFLTRSSFISFLN
jgi:hypothetical protein